MHNLQRKPWLINLVDHNEILNIRWATQDPNPLAMAREKRRLEEQAAEAIRRALPAEFLEELEKGDEHDNKRQRLMKGAFGLPGYEAPDELWYNRQKLLQGPESIRLPTVTEDTEDNSIFGQSTLERLKMLKQKEVKPPTVPATNGGLLGFGDYGNDGDEKED
jgi:hypothetical protein